MEWKELLGKTIFVQLKTGAVYSGDVIDVDGENPLIFISMIERKENKKITFAHSEIIKIVEENKNDGG